MFEDNEKIIKQYKFDDKTVKILFIFMKNKFKLTVKKLGS